jgi:hypothetical protein
LPHALNKYRDDIDGMIGPIEGLIAQFNELPKGVLKSYVGTYVLGGLEQAIETLESARCEIDEYEEPETDPVDPEEEDTDEADDDEEDD